MLLLISFLAIENTLCIHTKRVFVLASASLELSSLKSVGDTHWFGRIKLITGPLFPGIVVYGTGSTVFF
ncbi:MAG: hypothetical protein K6L75_08680 [Cellvibrionaceae bacterium]